MINQTQSRKVRYQMRDEIENILKEQDIDKNQFHEAPKNIYEEVIRKTYYSFCDYQKYPTIQIKYMWCRLRNTLAKSDLIHTDWKDWCKYIDRIDELISDENPDIQYYLITDGGWVYEGTLIQIKKVLYEYPGYMEAFYILSRDYKWLILHIDDGGCMYKVWK